ncbi:hypothetical protein KI811_08960 [Geobacter hydrogenophilus]|uniref:Uncharacterized protein n=1 Tax=Geobacter hydrogenophilus TaxID=40983 RepID=A0A9W6LCU0_9BACT|nr:hypothetical protein [Geobacter hydrogenophilus]MBT0893940.1 hypothetical protein [Geobacter hydrogenophilus]GLI38114.1 hypothetical protein GHYDROH2_16150 [Geobacter hydrogenophilus]
MKGILGLAGLMIYILVLAGSPALAEQPTGKQLSATEIRKTIIGNTTRLITKKGNKIVVFWKETGTVYGTGEAGGRVSGTWKITDEGQLCSSWNTSKWESGCRNLFLDEKTGQIQNYNREGTPTGTIIEILPGNPEQLY